MLSSLSSWSDENGSSEKICHEDTLYVADRLHWMALENAEEEQAMKNLATCSLKIMIVCDVTLTDRAQTWSKQRGARCVPL